MRRPLTTALGVLAVPTPTERRGDPIRGRMGRWVTVQFWIKFRGTVPVCIAVEEDERPDDVARKFITEALATYAYKGFGTPHLNELHVLGILDHTGALKADGTRDPRSPQEILGIKA